MAKTDSRLLSPFRQPLFLGIDAGTSGVRAIVIDSRSRIVCQAQIRYHESIDRSAKINPQSWWQALTEVLDELQSGAPEYSGEIAAIGIDGTSSSVLICDEQGEPLTEALMYYDTRAMPQAEKIRKVAPRDHPATAVTSGLAKWLWLKDNTPLPDHYRLLHQADWLAGKLADQFDFSDENNTLKSGYDPLHQCWPDWVKSLVAHPDALPRVYPAGQAVCRISPTMARAFSFSPDTLVVAGTTDSTAAVIATGASKVGDAITSLGSTLVLKIICESPVHHAQAGIYSQPLGQFWLAGGASSSGGAVLRQYFTDQQMREYQSQIDVQQPTGLDYYPLPAKGERFPFNDPQMESRTIPRPQSDILFFQSLLEGIANIEYLGYKKLHDCGAPWPDSVRTTGGGSKNPAWKIIRQKILGLPMLEVQHDEAAYGTAVLARRGWQSSIIA